MARILSQSFQLKYKGVEEFKTVLDIKSGTTNSGDSRSILSPRGSALIDPATNTVKQKISFAPEGFRKEDITPVGLVMTKDGKTAFVTIGRANRVAVVDVASRKVETYILVGNRAWNAALNADESLLFVANGLSDDVSVIDVPNRKVLKSIPVGRVPYMVVVDD